MVDISEEQLGEKMLSKNQKIALVRHCNYGIETMTDKSYWFICHLDDVDAGDFVVTENFLPGGKGTRDLAIGYCEKVATIISEKLEEKDYPKSIVVSRIVKSGVLYKKPVLNSEYEKLYSDKDEENI